MMRILFCNYEYPPLGGGGGVINAQIAEELSKRHEVTVLTSGGLGLSDFSEENGVKIYRLPVFFRTKQTVSNLISLMSFVIMGLFRAKSVLKGQRFDVINTHFVVPSGPVGQMLADHYHIPNILSAQGGDIYDPSKFLSPHRHFFLRWLVKRLLKKADDVVISSDNLLNNIHNFYLPDLNVHKIPLAIKRSSYPAASRADYGIGEDEVVLVTVGRVVARKGLSQLIEIMDKLQNENVRLLIIGSGPLEDELKMQVNESNLQEKVVFLGQIEEKEKFHLLNMSDIYVSTSQHEGFGIVFLEGMAAGLPVICYDHGGQTDYLIDEKTGYVVHLNEIDLFSKKLQGLIQDKALRQTMGENCLSMVENYYIDHCAKQYEQLFEEAIQRQ